MEWTEEMVTRLRVLWTEGRPTAEIGRAVGISKNAIVGKAHRLGLAPRPSPIRRETARTPDAAAESQELPEASLVVDRSHEPKPVTDQAREQKTPERRNVRPAPAARLVATRGTVRTIACCWPIGEPATPGFRFCGAPALPGKPYCAEHAALAYVHVRERREDAA